MRVWMTKQDKSITNIKLQIAALCEKSYKNCRFLVFSTMRGYRQYATLIKDIEHNTPSSVHLAFGPFEAMPQNYVDNFDAIILVAGDGESALKMLGDSTSTITCRRVLDSWWLSEAVSTQ